MEKDTQDTTSVKPGDKVQWCYWHYLNSKSRTRRCKTGVVIRKITPKKKFLADWSVTSQVMVQFDGNKKPSKVPINELTVL